MATPTILIVPDRYKSGVLYSQLPESGAVDFDVTRATTAYRTNASGILESVASGVPRLDYPAAGGCPSLLVEPAATNLALRSEEFDDVSWIKLGGSSVTANTTTSPDGNLTADTLSLTANAASSVARDITFVSTTTITISVYAKVLSGTKNFRLRADNPVTTQAFTATTSWQRFSMTATPTGNTSVYVINDLAATAGDLIIWGFQVETGSVATSYIPTVAATATRNADVISKTGVSGFIGQTEGTIYAEVDVSQLLGATARTFINIGSASNSVFLGFTSLASNTIRLAIDTTAGAGVVDFRVVVSSAGTIKVAAAYKNGDCALYVNGVAGTIVANGSISFTTISNLFLGQTLSSTAILNDSIRAAAIYPTRLSNDELSSLTTL